MADLNATPSSERVHIGIFGKRNAGKSSLVNAITGQNLAIVSPVMGTTTDPVYKSMEILPLGPVEIIDTPGLDDDEGELGLKRIEKAYQVLNKTDIALLVVDATIGMTDQDYAIVTQFQAKNINFIIAYNKADLLNNREPKIPLEFVKDTILVSSITKANIKELKERLAHLVPSETMTGRIIGDLLHTNDLVILVVPIDSAAPKGRLILPQQQVIRDTLESGATALVVRESELMDTLNTIGKNVRMVVTDSQAFSVVSTIVPDYIPLTSFSILFARYKGDVATAITGAKVLSSLQAGDKILIAEGCTHHRQCDDIGSVKLPKWIKEFTGCTPVFEFCSGTEFPQDLRKYKLVVHCGGCMLNEREMQHRIKVAKEQNVPITNYGIVIAYMNGILKRAIAPLPDLNKLL